MQKPARSKGVLADQTTSVGRNHMHKPARSKGAHADQTTSVGRNTVRHDSYLSYYSPGENALTPCGLLHRSSAFGFLHPDYGRSFIHFKWNVILTVEDVVDG
jgi:hypothetical protein